MIAGLKDKVVIVTGGAHGIGKAYCIGFGEPVRASSIADIDDSAAEASADKSGAAEALAVQVDVPMKTRPRKWPRRLSGRFGRIDVLINNAAIFRRADEPRQD